MFRTNGCERPVLDRFNPRAQWAQGVGASCSASYHTPKSLFFNPAVWLWKWECQLQNSSETQPPAPWNAFLPSPRPSPPSSSPPQIHFLSPSLGQSQEPLTSYCGMLIEKKEWQLGVFLTQKYLFLTEKKDEQIIFMPFAIATEWEKLELRVKR